MVSPKPVQGSPGVDGTTPGSGLTLSSAKARRSNNTIWVGNQNKENGLSGRSGRGISLQHKRTEQGILDAWQNACITHLKDIVKLVALQRHHLLRRLKLQVVIIKNNKILNIIGRRSVRNINIALNSFKVLLVFNSINLLT